MPAESRVHCQRDKEPPNSITATTTSRSDNRHNALPIFPATGKNNQDNERGEQGDQEPIQSPNVVGQSYGPTSSEYQGSTVGESSHHISTDVPQAIPTPYHHMVANVPQNTATGKNQPDLVAIKKTPQPRKVLPSEKTRTHIHGCKPPRLGSHTGRTVSTGHLDNPGSAPTDQHVGTKSNKVSIATLPTKYQTRPRNHKNRQYSGQVLHQPPGGSRSTALRRDAARILRWAESHLLSLRAEHIQGIQNTMADWLSRQTIQEGEWALNKQIFREITQRFGCPEIDLFANNINKQVERFWSRFPHREAEATDTLMTPWPKMLLYAFPPTPLIPRVLRKIQQHRAEVILVAPYWPR